MPTKFYLFKKTTEFGAFNGASIWPVGVWNAFGSLCYYGQLMDTSKQGHSQEPDTVSFSTAPGNTRAHYRGLSRRLMPQTISGTIDGIFLVRQQTDVNTYTRLIAYIVNTTGDLFNRPVVAYLVTNYQETAVGGATEWPIGTGGSVGNFTPQRFQAPVAITPYVVPDDGNDYRIVLELGCQCNPGATTNCETGMRFGTRGADYIQLPDLVMGPVNTVGAPFIEFSGDIGLKPLNYYPNHEPEFATDMVGTTPSTVAQVGDSQGEYSQWYRYTHNNAVNRTVSVLLCAPASPGGYCYLKAFKEADVAIDGVPFTKVLPSLDGSNAKKPLMIALKANTNLYLSAFVGSNAGNIASLSVTESPLPDIKVGDLMVNADNSTPNTFDPTIPGDVGSVWYRPDGQISWVGSILPFSELGVCLATGKFGIPTQSAPHELFIYSEIGTPAIVHRVAVPGSVASCGTDMKSFYLAIGDNTYNEPPTIYKYSDTGVVNSKFWILTVPAGDAIKNFGVSRDGEIVYIVNNNTDEVHRHNLVTDLPMAPFSSKPAGSQIADIIVMSDNTIVTTFSGTPNTLYHYSPDGTVLHTTPLVSGYAVDHIVHEFDDSPDKVWIWFQRTPPPSYKFQLVRITDGTVIKEFDSYSFSASGMGPLDAGCNPQRFGVGISCALFMMMAAAVVPTSPDLSGIYFINPEKKHDTYYTGDKKIPDPTIKTALLGE